MSLHHLSLLSIFLDVCFTREKILLALPFLTLSPWGMPFWSLPLKFSQTQGHPKHTPTSFCATATGLSLQCGQMPGLHFWLTSRGTDTCSAGPQNASLGSKPSPRE